MSVRMCLLALLDEGATHGYELHTRFQERTAGLWPLNTGQVYTTLERLERDELIEKHPESGRRLIYRITDAGRVAVEQWLSSAQPRTQGPARDEVAMKIVFAANSSTVDAERVLSVERSAVLRAMTDHTRAKAALATAQSMNDLMGALIIEAQIAHAQADLAWLDYCAHAIREAAHLRAADGTDIVLEPADQTELHHG